MICYACQSKMEEGRAKCPVCGFPVIQSVEGNADEIERIRQMAKEYMRQRTSGMTGDNFVNYLNRDQRNSRTRTNSWRTHKDWANGRKSYSGRKKKIAKNRKEVFENGGNGL